MINFFTDERMLKAQKKENSFGPGDAAVGLDNAFHLTSLHQVGKAITGNPSSVDVGTSLSSTLGANASAPAIPMFPGRLIACPVYNYVQGYSANNIDTNPGGSTLSFDPDIVVDNDRRCIHRMNLILQPFAQPRFPFPKIKYIIYRNVRIASFLNLFNNYGAVVPAFVNNTIVATGTTGKSISYNAYEAVVRDGLNAVIAPTTANDPLAYCTLNIQHNKTFFPGNAGTVSFGRAYGAGVQAIQDNQYVDELFAMGYGINIGAPNNLGVAAAFDLAPIGQFADEFGVEVIVENENFNLTVGAVRKKMTSHVSSSNLRADGKNNSYFYIETGTLNVGFNNSLPSDYATPNIYASRDYAKTFKDRLVKEEILQYMDPCALYGSYIAYSAHRNYIAPVRVYRGMVAGAPNYNAVTGMNIYRQIMAGEDMVQSVNPTVVIRNGDTNANTIINGFNAQIRTAPSGNNKVKGIFFNKNRIYFCIGDRYGNSYNLLYNKELSSASNKEDMLLGIEERFVGGAPANYDITENANIFANYKEEKYIRDGWPLLCLERADIVNANNAIKINQVDRGVGAGVTRAAFFTARFRFPTIGNSQAEQHTIYAPLIAPNPVLRNNMLNDDNVFLRQVSLGITSSSPTDAAGLPLPAPLAFVDNNYAPLYHTNEDITPHSINIHFLADFTTNQLGVALPGIISNNNNQYLGNLAGEYLSPVCAYYSLKLITADIAIKAPDPNNIAEVPVDLAVNPTQAIPTNYQPRVPLEKFPSYTSYEYLDNIFKPFKGYDDIYTVLSSNVPMNGGAAHIIATLREDTTYVENHRMSGRDMMATMGAVMDGVNLPAVFAAVPNGFNTPLPNNFGNITFYAAQFKDSDCLGTSNKDGRLGSVATSSIGSITGAPVTITSMLQSRLPLISPQPVGAQVPFVRATETSFTDFLSLNVRTGLYSIVTNNNLMDGGVPITVRYIRHDRDNEINEGFAFVTFNQAEFTQIRQAYLTAINTLPGTNPVNHSTEATIKNINSSGFLDATPLLQKWITLAFVHDGRPMVGGNDIANVDRTFYTRYNVCIKGFQLQTWEEVDGGVTRTYSRLVERLIDTGVNYYFAGDSVNLGTTLRSSVTAPRLVNDPVNRPYEVGDAIPPSGVFGSSGLAVDTHYMQSKMHMVRDLHMSRQEFFDYCQYYQHNIEKVWTSYSGVPQHISHSNQGFQPRNNTGNSIRVINEIDLFRSTGLVFHELRNTENIVTTMIGVGRSFQIGRGMVMFHTPNQFTNDLSSINGKDGNPLYPATFYNDPNTNPTTTPAIYHENTPAHEYGHLLGLADRYAYLGYVDNANTVDNRRAGGIPFYYHDHNVGGVACSDPAFNQDYNWHHNLMTFGNHVPPTPSLWAERVDGTGNLSEIEYLDLFWRLYPKPTFPGTPNSPVNPPNRLINPNLFHEATILDVITVFITQDQWNYVLNYTAEPTHPSTERIFIIENVPQGTTFNGTFVGQQNSDQVNTAIAGSYLHDHDLALSVAFAGAPATGATTMDFNRWLNASLPRNDIQPIHPNNSSDMGLFLPATPAIRNMTDLANPFLVGRDAARRNSPVPNPALPINLVAHVHLSDLAIGSYPVSRSRVELADPTSGMFTDVLDYVMNLYGGLMTGPPVPDPIAGGAMIAILAPDNYGVAPDAPVAAPLVANTALVSADNRGMTIWNRNVDINNNPTVSNITLQTTGRIDTRREGFLVAALTTGLNFPLPFSLVYQNPPTPLAPDFPNYNWQNTLQSITNPAVINYIRAGGGAAFLGPGNPNVNYYFPQFANRYWLIKIAAQGALPGPGLG